MGRRPKPSVWDRLEDGLFTPDRLGQTDLDHFCWALDFAQGQVVELAPKCERDRCIEVAAFATYAKKGPAASTLARHQPSAAQITWEGPLREEMKAVGSRKSSTEARSQELESKRKALRDQLAQYSKGVLMPSQREMHVVKKTLAECLSQIGDHREVRYPRSDQVLRWNPLIGQYKADGTMMLGGRFVIVHRDTWADLATGYFLDLVARFGHRLDRCAAIQATRRQRACGRWFVRRVRVQRFCSKVCEKRQTMRESRAGPLVL